MTKIEILFLGPPEIRLNNRTLPKPVEEAQALLVYLASQRGPVEREGLLSLLWEGISLDEANRRLDRALEALRSVTHGVDLLAPGTTSSTVGLNFSSLFIDQLEFQNQVDAFGRRAWKTPARKPLDADVLRAMERAAGLWRSPHYLEGLVLPPIPRFQTWLHQEAHWLADAYRRVLNRLAGHWTAVGELEKALNLTRLAIIGDEWNQEMHANLLYLLIHLDRRAEALSYLQVLKTRLKNEPGRTLSDHIIELSHRLEQDRQDDNFVSSQLHWDAISTTRPPFIGRQDSLAHLQDAFVTGGATLVLGESGQGKTRLLQEFVERLERPVRLLPAFCLPGISGLPFQPIIHSFRLSIRQDEWMALDEVAARQLAILLPELAELRKFEHHPVEYAQNSGRLNGTPDEARTALLEAIRQVFLLISQREPVVFCLDNAHWADESTLAALLYLSEHPPFHSGALLLVAARNDMPSSTSSPTLELFRARLEEAPLGRVLLLPPLNRDEINELANRILNQPLSDGFLQYLEHETAGNTLFVLEALRSLPSLQAKDEDQHSPHFTADSQYKVERSAKAQGGFIAEGVYNLIRNRIHQLSEPAQGVLKIAAVVGLEFDVSLVHELGSYFPETLETLLQELQRQAWIQPASPAQNTMFYRFRHSKYQEVAIQELQSAQEKSLHGKLARILGDRVRGETATHAAILAHHYERSGAAYPAFHHWLLAARRARQLFSLSEAIQAYANARLLVPLCPGLSDESIHRLYKEWTDLAFEMEHADEIRKLNGELLDLGHERNSPRLIGTALVGFATACMADNRFEEGLNYAGQAIGLLEGTGHRFEFMEAYTNRGVFFYMLNRNEESVQDFQDALAIGVGVQDPLVVGARANAHYQYAITQILAGLPRIGLKQAERSFEDFQTTNQTYGQVMSLSAQALARHFLGQYEQARQDTDRGMEMAERIQGWRMLGYLHAYRAMIETITGNTDLALQHAEQAITIGERYGHEEILAEGYRIIGDIYLALKIHDQCVHYYRRSLELSKDRFLAEDHRFRLGWSLCFVGQREDGEALIQEAINRSRAGGMEVLVLMSQFCLASSWIMREEWEAGRRLALEVRHEADRRGILTTCLMADQLLGELALHAGDSANAARIFATVAEKAAQHSSPWIELRALVQLSRSQQALAQSRTIDAEIYRRALILLKQLDANTLRMDIRPYFQEFYNNTLADLDRFSVPG